MNVILLEKVSKLGVLGDQVEVKPGYARNYLVPEGRAVYATTENIAKFEAKRVELEKREQEKFNEAKERAASIEGIKVELSVKASDEGKLYGSLSTTDIAQAISNLGAKVERREIILPEGPIRYIGEHEVFVNLHSDIKVAVNFIVNPE